MKLSEGLAVSLNVSILSVFYTVIGACISYVFYYLFDEYDPSNKKTTTWEKRGIAFQLTDICLEIALISTSSFWIVFFMNEYFPIIPVRTAFAPYIDTYATGLFFMYTIFMFVDSFGNKLMYIFNTNVSPYFDYFFPQEGSLVNLSLRYRKKPNLSTE
jgi:hypothetical protein